MGFGVVAADRHFACFLTICAANGPGKYQLCVLLLTGARDDFAVVFLTPTYQHTCTPNSLKLLALYILVGAHLHNTTTLSWSSFWRKVVSCDDAAFMAMWSSSAFVQ